MNMTRNVLGSLMVFTAAACASAPGTRPHDMSASEHARAAAQHEETGTEHAAKFQPDATDATDATDCAPYLGSCWSSNPTEEHRDEARDHRELAAKHRAASQALRQVEAEACQGVTDMDRDIDPFVHRQAIVRGVPLTQPEFEDYGASARSYKQVGASVVVLPAAGLTAERLQRVVTCHVARAASLGHDAPELSFSPLAVKGAQASVRSAGNGFAIEISGDTRESAAEILARVQRLVAR